MARPALVLTAMLAVWLPLGASSAEMTEAERLKRCANNEERIEALQKELDDNTDFRTAEEVVDLRSELQVLNHAAAHWANKYQACLEYVGDVEDCSENLKNADPDEVNAVAGIIADLGFREHQQPFTDARDAIIRIIDRAVAAHPRMVKIEEDIRYHQNRLVELRCSSATASTASSDTASPGTESPGTESSGTTSSNTASSEPGGSCGLGKAWQMRIGSLESLEVWYTKDGGNQWSIRHPGVANDAHATVSLNGDRATATTSRDTCTYHGTLQGFRIEGTAECTDSNNSKSTFPWKATVICP